jgi:integrase
VTELVKILEPEFIIRPMMTIHRAIDLFDGDCSRRGMTDRTRATYRGILYELADAFPEDWDVGKLNTDDVRRFLDRRGRRHKRGTRAHAEGVLSSFFKCLYREEKIKQNPMDRLVRTRRTPADELDVVWVDAAEVRKLFDVANTWSEKLAVGVLCYLAPRRHAAALLRLRDYDRDRKVIRFYEKGGKVIWKPVPNPLADLIAAAVADGQIAEPADYIIPPEGPLARKGDRDDRVIWRIVKVLASRAGIDAHPHALRAAFAVYYLEHNPGDLAAVQAFLGHRSLRTTEIYLRRLNKATAMERVRTLDWTGNMALPVSAQFAVETESEPAVVGAGGFEPP